MHFVPCESVFQPRKRLDLLSRLPEWLDILFGRLHLRLLAWVLIVGQRRFAHLLAMCRWVVSALIRSNCLPNMCRKHIQVISIDTFAPFNCMTDLLSTSFPHHSLTNATSCLSCPTGSFSNISASVCTCSANYYSTDGLMPCTACSSNSFSAIGELVPTPKPRFDLTTHLCYPSSFIHRLNHLHLQRWLLLGHRVSSLLRLSHRKLELIRRDPMHQLRLWPGHVNDRLLIFNCLHHPNLFLWWRRLSRPSHHSEQHIDF